MGHRERNFAEDMMRFIARKYNIDWVPQAEQNPLSPFTARTVTGVEAALEEWDTRGTFLDSRVESTPYTRRFRDFSRIVVDIGISVGKECLLVCTSIARLAIIFYTNGQYDSPDIAIEVIQDVLHRFQRLCGTDIFQTFE